jgi:diphosphomevalonate decarboxylase
MSFMQATARAQPNIALVKYWGKQTRGVNEPAVSSLSITLDTLWTRTRVVFDPGLEADRFALNGAREIAQERRVIAGLELMRELKGTDVRASVESENNFPTGAGLASSASGFAALVTAADAALELDLPRERLSSLARRLSGSAARSLFGGFVELWSLRPGESDSAARPLLDAEEWPLEVVVAVVSEEAKAIGSTVGMELSRATSEFYPQWVEGADRDMETCREAVLGRDFEALAEVSERSCLKMHAVALSSAPGLIYWQGPTLDCMHRVRRLRESGTPVFFTVDAGPQVKAVCLPGHGEAVAADLGSLEGVKHTLITGLGPGARVVRG